MQLTCLPEELEWAQAADACGAGAQAQQVGEAQPEHAADAELEKIPPRHSGAVMSQAKHESLTRLGGGRFNS